MEIQGIAAIVTGGASGLGGATAAMLARAGAAVTILDVNEAAGTSHAEEIGALFQRIDVTDDLSIEQGLANAREAHGPARILVNCAGVASAIRTVSREGLPHSVGAFRKTVEINLVGSFAVLSQFAARLVAEDPIGEERGIAINTASVAAFDGQIGQAAYAASKGGVVGMTLPIARDLAQHLIRVVTVAPGIFWTPLLAGLPEPAQESLGRQVPHPSRLGRPPEFAQLVESIIRNPMLNGETIRLDGAIRMAPR